MTNGAPMPLWAMAIWLTLLAIFVTVMRIAAHIGA